MNNIYLIDDDMDDVEIFREALEEVAPAIALHYANDGQEAVHTLTQQLLQLPDLIFLDISMPYISGLQCLDTFKKHAVLKDVPVIMYTTTSRTKEIEQAKELGAAGFITKPSDFKMLKKILAAIITTPTGQLW